MEKEPVAPTMGIIILWSRMATLVFDFIAQPTESKIHEKSKKSFIYYESTFLGSWVWNKFFQVSQYLPKYCLKVP